MLTKDELIHLMTDLESETVERTRAFDKADKMGQAICAFANDLSDRNVPGYLLLGVNNDGTWSGKRIDDQRLTALGGLKTEGNLLPPPAMAMEVFHLDGGDAVVIEVFPSIYPPIRYQGQIWVRLGARKALATADDIHILEEKRLRFGRRFEEMPCCPARLSDLDLSVFKNIYLPRAFQAQVIEDDDRPIQEQMAALRFYDLKTDTPTNLGMLLFGKHPEMFIPSAYLQYVKFAGSDNSCDILAENAYKGPFIRMIDELNAFVKVGIASPHSVRISALQEETRYRYPDWSIRELLLNSIIHRDYQIGNAPIKFYDYDGCRIEITNPGGLYGQATPENFPHVSDYRNPLLAEAMKVMGFVNKFNRGIAKVKAEMAANGNPAPIFDVNKRTEFRVTLRPAHTADENLNENLNELKTPVGNLNENLNEHINELKTPVGNLNGNRNGNRNGSRNGNRNGSRNGNRNGNRNGSRNGNRNGNRNDKQAIIDVIAKYPGIQRKELSRKTGILLRKLDRLLKELKSDGFPQVEHRGPDKTGGWFIKT